MNILKTVVAIFSCFFGVILVFTTVSSQKNNNRVISEINEEAFLLEKLFQTASAFPKDARNEIQKSVIDYVKSVVNDEWLLMGKKMESSITLTKLAKMRDCFCNFQPKTTKDKIWYSELTGFLLSQGSARLKRVYANWQSISTLCWAVLIIGGILTIGFLIFLGMENKQLWLTSILSGYFALMVFVVYVLNNPLSTGVIKITPNTYQIVLNHCEELARQ